ncbi:PGA [Symbiodinium sp. CCMP2592]|nr:PGA [Symbiodinium sp. CCMP2592]
MIWLLLSLLLQAASGHQPSQVPKLRRANGTVTFNSWVMLDPASSQAFERTQNLRVHEFLPSYVRMYKAGKAQELMPDPFVDAPSLEGLPSKEGQVHDARALAELQLRGAPAAEGDAVQLPCRFEEDHDYIGVDALTVPHSNKEDCCRACRHLNRRKAGNCVVAVLSGPLDDPPHQCWIKTKILSAKVVKGVVACNLAFQFESRRTSLCACGLSCEMGKVIVTSRCVQQREGIRSHDVGAVRRKGITLFLVANKIDKDPLGEQTKRNLGAARAFSELKEIPYFEVSALQFLRVHKVFREMVENIILQPQLWSSDSLKEFYQKHKQQTILQDQCVLS